MREIKFRAWDKDEEEMICGINECLMNWDGLQHNVDRFLNMPSHIPVMEFTGLKDKNGKEIYEGDVILIKPNMVGSCIGEIRWHEKSFGFIFYNSRIWGLDDIPPTNKHTIEIIGNIYENPDLSNAVDARN